MKQIILLKDILINKDLTLENAMTKEINNNILEKHIPEDTIGVMSVCYDTKDKEILHCLVGYDNGNEYTFGYFYDYPSISQRIIKKIQNGEGQLLYNCQDNLAHKLSLLIFTYKKKMETIIDGNVIHIQKDDSDKLILGTQVILDNNDIAWKTLVSIKNKDISENIDLIYNEIATYLYCYRDIVLGDNIFEWI